MTCRHLSTDIHDSLECLFVCLDFITCALRWEVALVGDYHYWALLTPSWEPLSGIGQVQAIRIRDRTYEKSRIMALIYIFCKYIWVVFICIRVM